MPKITYPKITLSPAIIHSLCYAWCDTNMSGLMVKHSLALDLVRKISGYTDQRDLTEKDITNFLYGLRAGYIELT